MGNVHLISSVTPTICRLMRIEAPALADQEVLPEVVTAAEIALAGRTVQRILVFAPDAVGAVLFHTYRSMFDEVLR